MVIKLTVLLGCKVRNGKTHFKILLVTNGLYVRVCTTLHCRVKWNWGLGRILKQCKSGAIFSAKKALLAYLFLQKNTKSKNYFTNLYNSFQKLFHSNYLKFVFYSHHLKGYFCKTHFLAMQLSWDIFSTFDQFDSTKNINQLFVGHNLFSMMLSTSISAPRNRVPEENTVYFFCELYWAYCTGLYCMVIV